MLIGSFVAGALLLAVAALVVFGSGRFFQETDRWVVYFDGSVNGLGVGSAVKFRGVPIGQVTGIQMISYTDRAMALIPVYLETYPESIHVLGPEVDREQRLQDLISGGLRARLEWESLVTGQLYVALDFYPDTPVLFRGPDRVRDADTVEIPTLPSNMQVIENTLREAMDAIRKLPLKEIADNLSTAVAGLNELVNDPELRAAVGELRGALGEIRELASKTNRQLGPLLAEARSTLEGADEAAQSLKALVAPESPLQYQLSEALREVSNAARSVRALADQLDRQPDSLIFGRGGEKQP